jgi:hypothetical protein
MTAFDTLERGLATFLDQEAAAVVIPPDVVDEVLAVTAERGPRPAWLARLRAATGVVPAAAIADTRVLAVGLAIVGILALALLAALAGGQPRRGLGDVVPSGAPGTARSSAASATGEPADALLSTWVSDAVAPLPSIAVSGTRLRLVFASTGGTVGIGLPDGGTALASSRIQPRSAGELRLVLQRSANGCPAGAEGFYAYSFSRDGLVLTLATDSDQCTARRDAFARSWTRALTGQSNGGTGVVNAFDPAFVVTLPPGAFAGTTYTDAVEVDRREPELNLYAFKDPQGFTDPCAQDGGRRRPIEAGADAFADYVRSIPGFSVTATELHVDGHRALHLAVVQGGPAICTGERVVEWQPKAETGTLNWIIGIGDPDSIYVVELPTATILLQVIGPTHAPGPTGDERAIVDTVRFLETLPSSP